MNCTFTALVTFLLRLVTSILYCTYTDDEINLMFIQLKKCLDAHYSYSVETCAKKTEILLLTYCYKLSLDSRISK